MTNPKTPRLAQIACSRKHAAKALARTLAIQHFAKHNALIAVSFMNPVEHPAYYQNPPIIERVASVYGDMTEETFESLFEDWRSMVQADFPVYEPLKDWQINVKEVTEERIPVFDSTEPILKVTPRFSRKSSQQGFDWSLRCPVGQFTMNMHSNPAQGGSRRYSNLRDEYSKWLPRWLRHFEVGKIRYITLHYVNALSRITVPDFHDSEGNLKLGQVITVFAHIPGEHECLMPPLDCTATVRLVGPPGATLQLTVKDCLTHTTGAAVLVDFVVRIVGEFPADPDRIINLLDEAHAHIVKRFELVFTPEAKASFKPATS